MFIYFFHAIAWYSLRYRFLFIRKLDGNQVVFTHNVHTYASSILISFKTHEKYNCDSFFYHKKRPHRRHPLQFVFVCFCNNLIKTFFIKKNNLIKTLNGHIREWSALLFFSFFYIFIYKYLLTPSPFCTHIYNTKRIIKTVV